MVQRRGRALLAFEALERLPVLGERVGQELQGHEPAEAGVFGLVDDTHTATADLLDDPVMRDGLACARVAALHGAKQIVGCAWIIRHGRPYVQRRVASCLWASTVFSCARM